MGGAALARGVSEEAQPRGCCFFPAFGLARWVGPGAEAARGLRRFAGALLMLPAAGAHPAKQQQPPILASVYLLVAAAYAAGCCCSARTPSTAIRRRQRPAGC